MQQPLPHHSLDGFGEEGSEGEALRHVSPPSLLLLLVEAEVDPGGEGAAQRQPGKGVGEHVKTGQERGEEDD